MIVHGKSENWSSLIDQFLESKKAEGFEQSPAQVRGHLSSKAHFLGIVKEGRLAAFVVFTQAAGILEIIYLETHSQFRKQGLMEQLLGELFLREDFEQVWLEVGVNNLSAQKLYRKLGFCETGRRLSYYGDGSEALLMSLDPISIN